MATDGSSEDFPVDVMDRVLDKGIVIDAAVRVSVAGVELLGVDARVVVASIETYLRHADTIAYTDMAAAPARVLPPSPPPPLFAEPVAHPALEPPHDLPEARDPEATRSESVADPAVTADPAAPDVTGGAPDGMERPPAD
jgi:hypothetical protein